MTAQRFRVWFRKGERVRYISHLDVLRSWERSLRRAGLPLAYSQGFTPHPRIAFASPLPLGFIGDAEVMDVTLDDRVAPADFARRLAAESTDDLAVIRIEEVPASAPAPQAALAWADYAADIPGLAPAEAGTVVASFLAAGSFSWTDDRKDRGRAFDLRAVVANLTVTELESGVRLTMRLQADQQFTARPEQVLAALFPGHEGVTYRRIGVVIEDPSPARDAWRRVGRYV
jgi:radical SAM-linked protein